MYIKFSDAEISESIENKPGVIIDYDHSAKIVGIEVLNASKNMEHFNTVETSIIQVTNSNANHIMEVPLNLINS